MAALKVFGKLSLRGSLSNHVTKVSAVYKSTQVPAFDETDVTATDVEITDAKPKPFSEMPGKLAPSSVQICIIIGLDSSKIIFWYHCSYS